MKTDIEKVMNESYQRGIETGYTRAHKDIIKWLIKRFKKSNIMDVSLEELSNKLDELLEIFNQSK